MSDKNKVLGMQAQGSKGTGKVAGHNIEEKSLINKDMVAPFNEISKVSFTRRAQQSKMLLMDIESDFEYPSLKDRLAKAEFLMANVDRGYIGYRHVGLEYARSIISDGFFPANNSTCLIRSVYGNQPIVENIDFITKNITNPYTMPFDTIFARQDSTEHWCYVNGVFSKRFEDDEDISQLGTIDKPDMDYVNLADPHWFDRVHHGVVAALTGPQNLRFVKVLNP